MFPIDRLALWALALLPLWASAEDNLRPFDTTSYQSILAEHRDQPFVLAFWSLDCPPCHRELAELGRWLTAHPDTVLVLVSTDENAAQETEEVLREHGLDKAENWVTAMPFDTPLRFTIDPLWYGELPRSYLFDTDHDRQAVSGVLGEEPLVQWRARNTQTPAL